VTFNPPVLDPDACLKDRRGVAFHGSVLFLTRLFLGVAENISVESWIVTTVAAIVSLGYNLLCWPWTKEPTAKFELLDVVHPTDPDTVRDSRTDADLLNSKSDPVYIWHSPYRGTTGRNTVQINIDTKESEHNSDLIHALMTEEPTIKASIVNCPWPVLPFVYGMFILVNALKDAGWIEVFAQPILDILPGDEGSSMRAMTKATLLMVTISFGLCSIIDNQPASIILTQVLISPVFDTLPASVRRAGMLGVLEGANVGACWSLIGALAGIMWSTILSNKGIVIRFFQFMSVGLKIMPLTTFIIALVIILENAG